MSRKKSIKRTAKLFQDNADEIIEFIDTVKPGLSKEFTSWIYEHAVIRLYREFEIMMLDALVGAINNDTTVLSDKTGFDFPKHLTDEVCKYLVIGDGYFDFKGRDGLIRTLKSYVPSNHSLVSILTKAEYKDSLDKLSTLRNFAAHDSSKSKKACLSAIRQRRIGSAGSWIKVQDRFQRIVNDLKAIAVEIEAQAPY